MLIKRKIRLALVFLTTTAGLIFSQEKATILHWTDREGLSSNKVSAICRGSNGFVWIGTNNGLNKFDGYSIKPFYSSNKKQFRISSNLVYDIHESTDGKIWVATDKGLNRIDPNRNTTTFYDHSTMQQVALPNTSVRSILPDSSGMWLGCEARDLAFWDFSTNRITSYPFRSYAFQLFPILRYKLFYISKIEKVNRDLYLLDANVGLFLFDRKKEKFECLDNYLGLPLERKSNFPRSFYHCSWGNTIASYNINNQSFKKITIGAKTAIFNEKPLVNNIVVVNDSTQWLLSDAGLFILNSTRGTAVKVTSTPYPYGQLNTAFKEIDGSIWVGGNEGLWFLKHSRIPFSERKLVTTVATGNHNLLNYMVEDEESRLRYCPENYGNNLYLLSTNGAFRKIPFEDELRFVTQTPDKSLWLSVGTSMKRQPKGAKVFSDFPIPNAVFDPNKKFRFTDVKEDSEGNLWFATNRDGLAVYRQKSRTWWKPSQKDSFISNSITKIEYSAKTNSVWIASDDYGLWNFDPTHRKFRLYRPSESDPLKSINSYVITDICSDVRGNLCFATLDGGFSTYDHQRQLFTHHTTKEGLSSDLIYTLIVDHQNRVWLATDRGIDCFNPTSKEVSHFDEKYFGQDFDKELTLNKLQEGKILFGTRSGYVEFHPDSLLPRNNPKVMLSSLKVLDREIIDSIDLSQEIVLSWLDNLITLELTTDQSRFDQKTSFAYRIEDMGETWNKIDKGNILTLSYLPYGNHKLSIKVFDNGLESNQILTLQLKIRPPFYRTMWFYFGIILLLAAVLYFFIRLKFKQIRSEASMRNSYSQQIAKIEMSALRAQMNPHFIFNCLNSINRFILVHDTEAASAYLTKFSRLIRLILDSSKAEYVSLDKELQALTLYVEMESMRFQDSFQFSLKIEEGLDIETVPIPPLLVQPFVENAIWHGLMQSATDHPKTLQIQILQDENQNILIEITDNGIGRIRAKELKSKSLSQHKSYGITMTQERLSLMNQAKNKHSAIQIEDLYDENGAAIGTKVTITIENDESNISG